MMRIGLDIGSSSAKAILIDPAGRVLRSARRRFTTRRALGGRVEHDPEGLYRAAITTLHAAADALPAGGPAALGIATQRSTMLFWDRRSGRPLTPALSWQDLRAAALCRRLRQRHRGAMEQVAAITGLRLSAHYAAPKIAWALRSLPGLRRRVARGEALWGTLGTWLFWRLTEGALYAVDHANAQRTALFDLDRLAWEPSLFELFGIADLLDAPALPALVPTSLAGGAVITVRGRALRLAASTGDQQAALVGLGCRRAGDVAINYGSGAFVMMRVGAMPRRVPGLLTTLVSSRHASGGGCVASFAVEGPVNAAATALDWVARRIGRTLRTGSLDRILGTYDPDSPRTLAFLPAVAGLGAPHWDETARPRFAGEIDAATREDMVRAAVESIAHRCAEIVRAARRTGALRPGGRNAVRVSGGLTRCRYLLQVQADLLQRPLHVLESRDATALGAALQAGAAEAPAPRPARASVIDPRSTAAAARRMQGRWERAVYGCAG